MLCALFSPEDKNRSCFLNAVAGGEQKKQNTMFKTKVTQTEKLTHFTLVSLLKQNDNQIYHRLHLSQTPHFAHTVRASCMSLRG